jgi:hypothetical protein
VRQVEKVAPLGDMMLQHMRCMHCFFHRHYVDAFNALEKSAKYPLEIFNLYIFVASIVHS